MTYCDILYLPIQLQDRSVGLWAHCVVMCVPVLLYCRSIELHENSQVYYIMTSREGG